MKIVDACKVEELFSVRDKVVLVVGAGGLGAYLGRGLAVNGAKVVFTNTTLQKAQKVQKELAAEGLTVDAFALNATDNDAVIRVVAEIKAKYGRIDVLLDTTGIGAHSDPEDYDPALVREIIDVNLNSLIFVTREVGRVMIEQGGGKMILIGSIAGAMCHTYLSMPYECSKAAVHQLTRSLAGTWAKHNINVNCIAPTWVYTPMLDDLRQDVYDTLMEHHPAGRIAQVGDFMGLALYLASDASSYVTGQTIYVDGGWTAAKPVYIPPEQRSVREPKK